VASRLIWIVLALALAIFGITTKPLVLGLDLKGGVTMRYELEPPDGYTGSEDLGTMIDATVATLRERINYSGIRESAISRQGEREIVVELPGSSTDEALTIESVLSRVGRLEFRIVLRSDGTDDDARDNVVIANELPRLTEMLASEAYLGKPADDIDVSSLDITGQDAIYRWYPYSDRIIAESRTLEPIDWDNDAVDMQALTAAQPLTANDFRLVKNELAKTKTFTGADIRRAQATSDENGNPAVGIYMDPARASEFGDWTEPNINRPMGMLLDGRLAQQPANINSRLSDSFVIQSGALAGFSRREISDYLTVIKSGSLQMKPHLLFKNTVGPSLGEASIAAGTLASFAGFIAIILFMLFYYRWNGAIASLCLVVNMVLLAGILMFLGATLTLPGIAGLVLTLGMAVDANILVFERMREESDRSKGVDQAVKLGFEKAFSTIVDANVTTFATGFILYKVGTGPVRGFSVILMMGILTSVFSVLFVGRLLYDFLVERGFTGIQMGRLIKKETSLPFMSKGRVAIRISAVLVIASLVAFFAADRDKYGMDFLGGYKAQVRLGEETTQGELSQQIAAVFDGVQVISVLDETATDPGKSKLFVVKVKDAPSDDMAEMDPDMQLEDLYENPLRAALKGLVLPDFVTDLTLTEDEATASTAISCVLHFEQPEDSGREVTPEKVAGHLGFLSNISTSAAGGGVALSGRLPRLGLDEQLVVQRLRSSLKDAADLPPASEPFVESTTIGSRVGTELRDSAIRAILLSFIAIVLYIRVRFREYRYGIAAIIALAHDVCITLGVVALMHFSGIVDVEIDVAMIAAFLTIIGYSLNDTIVLFDRIRENLPRMKGKSFDQVLDISINQTLSRTVLTSLTTLTALGVIFYFNYGKQNVLEGFSFAMIIGVVVGTYSSIFVASPALMMLADDTLKNPPQPSQSGGKKKKKKGGDRNQPEGVPA
jgi:SecD/SecF fusion protein